ncbi:MAG: gamma-glutamylcyclotransferase [Planctomycetales bacterium]|nr:gamma-glutamylcyclotransferase [Planctomycetales bacterium]
MWVFGYGSLMWDGWQTQHKCLRMVKATLPGFRRAFNKASVHNWGTRERPGPTLNIIADPARSCVGLAFEFPDDMRESIVAAFKRREGRNFELAEREVILDEGAPIQAVTPRYVGPNLIVGKSLTQLAEMARLAIGTDGKSTHYVRGIVDKLVELEIDDPAVGEFSQAVGSGEA